MLKRKKDTSTPSSVLLNLLIRASSFVGVKTTFVNRGRLQYFSSTVTEFCKKKSNAKLYVKQKIYLVKNLMGLFYFILLSLLIYLLVNLSGYSCTLTTYIYVNNPVVTIAKNYKLNFIYKRKFSLHFFFSSGNSFEPPQYLVKVPPFVKVGLDTWWRVFSLLLVCLFVCFYKNLE